uniref:tyrosine-type recombinase/integrase n=1 Tax=Roseibium sp. TaxID=1936156 RepID=UPI003D0DF8B8
PKVEKTPMRAASVEWFEKLIPQLPPRLAALLAFLATTGCRISEALFADFDLEKRTAVIGFDKRGQPKIVEFPIWVQVMIANLPESETASIFGYAERRSVYETLKRACKKAKVPYLTPHQAGRHTFATNLLKAGKSLAFVKDAGHWSSGRLVMETYGHLEHSDVRKSATEVGENWGKLVSKASK